MSEYEFVLINYPPSISSERIRWVLTHYGIPFQDRRMSLSPQLLFTVLFNFPRFRRAVPYLKDKTNKLYFGRSREVVKYFDPLQPEEKQIQAVLNQAKSNRVDSAEIDQIERNIGAVGKVIRQWAYSYITPVKELFLDSITAGAPVSHKAFSHALYPVIAFLTRNSLTPEAEGVAEAHKILVAAFDSMDQLLGDERQFLFGNRLTTLDIRFCVHAAPCVMAPEYGGGNIFPTFGNLPETMQPFVKEFRERPAGKYVLRMYENFRN